MKLKLIIVLALSFFQFSYADISLPNIFSSNMVLQRESEVFLYGWASPSEEFFVHTSWDGNSIAVKTGNNAKWKIKIETPKAGGPYEIEIKGKNNTILLRNILMGEVWLGSGQSNMEWSANSGIDNKEEEIKNADYPNIRLFTVEKRTADAPQDNLVGTWEVCSSETMVNFSAVSYFFARKLKGEMNIPIGLIDSSWGASCAEVWTPEYVFDENPELLESYKLIQPNQWVTIERSTLYNAMIAPITDFKIAGVLWYQGESNTANAESYANLFKSMIKSWRKARDNPFPFYVVQIAPFKYGGAYQGAIVRNQQRLTLELENTGMVVTSDICTIDDIHPQNKQDVGLRLANIALKEHYGVIGKEVHSPLFQEAIIKGNKIEVAFSNAEGLYSKGKEITDFEVAGTDEVFYPAKAKIVGSKIVVGSKKVKEPKNVRFAWHSTAIPNLYNGANLPASTFSN